MNMPAVAEGLKTLKPFEDAYTEAMRDDLAWWHDIALPADMRR
jgi:hypothetical protein